MKRVSKLFASCLCIFAMASIIGCKNDDGGGSDEFKASVNKATAASVSVEKGTYDSIATENDKTTINAALDSAGIDKIIASATDYSDFVQDGEDDSGYYSMRAITTEALGAQIYKDLEEKITKYYEDLDSNGKASFSYSIAPGEIAGLPDGIKMTIPLFFISQSTSSSADGTSSAQSYTQGICSTYFEDFTKTEPDSSSYLKQTAVNSAQNYNYNIATVFDPTKLDSDKIQNGDYTNISDFMTIKGSAKINLETTSYTSFVIKGIAGKISTELNLAVKFNDFDKIFDEIGNDDTECSISPETFINSETSKGSLKINVCDLNGNVIYNYKTITNISELESYISLFDLSSVISGTNESEK